MVSATPATIRRVPHPNVAPFATLANLPTKIKLASTTLYQLK